ncbi:hypothetical protein [Formosa haliotis]|uniref:hypothetical protein n=1 Tax=Formosa haliotis TaxID=1555194 RepID=UPI001146F7F4|nr:hypothetical protein [Formosa haliotis]
MKRFSVILICLSLWACNSSDKKEVEPIEEEVSPYVLKDDISKLKYVEYGLDEKAKVDTETWDKFAELSGVISQLKAGDVSYFQGDSKTILLLMKEVKESMPEKITSPSIAARFLTLETKMLKLQSLLSLRNIPEDDQLQAIKEILVAYSNLNLQINKKYEKDAQKINKP